MNSKSLKKIIGIVAAVTIVSNFYGITSVRAQETSALGVYYGTNPNEGVGKNKTITIDGKFDDWSEDMLIAQGVANDDPRIFRGSHEGPVYDTYALYSAWDDENLYFMWQYTNVTDVVDPAQGYPISDNGKPYNGDIPIMLALNTGTLETSDGTASDGKTVWGLNVKFNTAVDKLLCFSAKPGVGQPAIFSAVDGKFDYESCLGFKKAGVKYAYGDGFLGSKMNGINANGYSGYKPEDLTNLFSNWVDFLNTNHNTKQDTMYEMAIPLKALGMTKADVESNGLGAMLISTFGASGIGSLPMDMTFLDNACTPYSSDESTSGEKEDVDIVNVPLARVGTLKGGIRREKVSIDSFTSSSDTSINVGDSVIFNTKASGSKLISYKYEVNGEVIKDYDENSEFQWRPEEAGNYEIKVTAKNSYGLEASKAMNFTVEDKSINEIKVEENSKDILYGAGWNTVYDSSYLGGAIAATDEDGAFIQYTFNGTGIKLLSLLGPDKGIAKVVLDGKVYSADMFRSKEEKGGIAFEKLDLLPGEHTIIVKTIGVKSKKSAGTLITVDAFKVINN